MRRTMRKAALAAALTTSGIFSAVLPFTSCFDASTTWAQEASTAPSDAKTNVPVKAVILYSSGVGYFQHAGLVKGDATTQLQFNTSQINDVLKSLVLQDKGGSVSQVTYASQNPLEKTLKSFQVDITANPSLDQLLNQLRGAKVTLDLAGEHPTGTILGVEHRIKPAGENKTVDVPVLNLVSGASIRAIELTDVRDLHFEDPELQDELTKALVAVAASRDKDKKPVTVHFKGTGEREVLLGYVVEAPVWKTSYRLVLGDPPKDKNDKPITKLQGWAIVENQTDNDWNDIQLSLVSGRPISFIEDLYAPLYLQRATVQPELYASLQPRVYEAGNTSFALSAAGMPQDGLQSNKANMSQALDRRNAAMAFTLADAAPLEPAGSVLSQASAAQLGELFEYTVGSVSLPRQSSAMIPIVTDDIQAERVSIYNAAVMPHNPLNGARLKNTTGKHLLGGPITVLDANTYAGDAQIENTPPGQDRLISYGVDLQTTVQTGNDNFTDEIMTGKIVKGIMQVTHKSVSTIVFNAQNKGDRDKTLIIEQPIQSGWDLIDTPDPIEKTDSLYRFQQVLQAGKSLKLTVKLQNVHNETFVILNTDVDAVIAISRGGAIPKDVKDALVKAAGIRQNIVGLNRARDENRASQAAIVEDQKRINETLRTIGQNTDLYTRLMKKLNDQESQLEKLRDQEADASKSITDSQKELEDYLANLNVG
ncbi:MAG: DUF4139 domain-containing protein [Planctomycetota bacterium]|nr:DUF4139 domain-containing protein [Planctomycetota bacterium]